MISYYVRGAIGDVLYSLPAIKQIGGGIIYTGLKHEQYSALKPLIDAQPYIKGFHHEWEGLPMGFINLEDFVHHQKNPNHICQSFGKVLGFDVDYKTPWLILPNANPEPTRFSYAVVNVTPRYRDKVFSWARHLKFLRDNTDDGICFLGHYDEYRAFVGRYGEEGIRYRRTENLLEAAHIIARAKYFSGTQSSLLSIAEGLGRPYFFERSPFHDNCLTGRDNETVLNNHTRKWHLAISRTKEVYRNFMS